MLRYFVDYKIREFLCVHDNKLFYFIRILFRKLRNAHVSQEYVINSVGKQKTGVGVHEMDSPDVINPECDCRPRALALPLRGPEGVFPATQKIILHTLLHATVSSVLHKSKHWSGMPAMVC